MSLVTGHAARAGILKLLVRLTACAVALMAWNATPAAEIMAAAKSDWIYYSPWYIPQASAPCFTADMAAAVDEVARIEATPNVCTAVFSNWSSPWPDGDGRTDWRQLCPAPGIPITWGYQRRETRQFQYESTNLSCTSPQTNASSIERQRFYYCQDSTNYEIFQPPYQPGPMIPACRLKFGKVEPKKQPRKDSDCCKVGNPISIATGAKYQREVDYVGAGTFPLKFERHYWAGAWTHSQARAVVRAPRPVRPPLILTVHRRIAPACMRRLRPP